VNFAPAIQACHFVIHQPGQDHEPESQQKLIAKRRGSRRRILPFQSLQHADYIGWHCPFAQSDLANKSCAPAPPRYAYARERFLAGQSDKARAQERGGGQIPVSLDP
jgi:hypothetical protein